MNIKIRTALIATVFAILPFLGSAQTGNKGGAAPAKADTAKVKSIQEDENKVHESSDEAPDLANFNQVMLNNLVYPPKAAEDGIQGVVEVSFVVEKDGSLSNITITKSLTPECDEAVIHMIKTMPAWTPGKIEGKPVRVNHSVTVNFTLNGGSAPAKKEKKKKWGTDRG